MKVLCAGCCNTSFVGWNCGFDSGSFYCGCCRTCYYTLRTWTSTWRPWWKSASSISSASSMWTAALRCVLQLAHDVNVSWVPVLLRPCLASPPVSSRRHCRRPQMSASRYSAACRRLRRPRRSQWWITPGGACMRWLDFPVQAF